jgi:choline-sulfatase
MFQVTSFWSFALGVSLGLTACAGAGVGDDAKAPPKSPARAASSAAKPAEPGQGGEGHPAEVVTAAASSAGEAGPRVHYDFVAHATDAALRYRGAQYLDFAGERAADFTLGGWQTQAGPVVTFKDARGTLFGQTTGKVIVPFDAAGAHRVRFLIKAVAKGPLTVYFGDDSVREAELDPAQDVVAIDVPVTAPAAGDQTFQFRTSKRAPVGAGREGAMLLVGAWVLPPSFDGDVPSAVPALAAGKLALPAGWSATFPFVVPDGASLSLRAGAAPLRWNMRVDGRAPVSGSAAANAAASVPLDAVAGHAVAVELTGEAGAALDATGARVSLAQRSDCTTEHTASGVKNVIVFLVDTLRADKLTAINEKTRVRTPGMDALARTAAVFTSAHTHENWTKPSVATVLSGLLPWQHQATTGDAKVPESVDLLSEMLQDKGYFTGTFIANGYVSDKFGFKQGWHTYRNYIREGRRTQANFVAADVLDWLDKRPKEKPFFLYIHTIDPHVPYIPPDEIVKTYDANPYDGPVNFLRDRTLLENIKIGKQRVNDRDKQRLETLYDSEITFHDIHMASIFAGLEKRGLKDSTMVVLTADHGEELFDHGSVGHGHSVWEELLHVPLVVRIPGVTFDGAAAESTRRVSAPAGHADIVPTVLETVGLPVPKGLPGRSLLTTLACAETAPRHVVSGFMDGWRTAVSGSLKLVHRSVSKYAVYDLAKDPRETTDIAASHPVAVRTLRALLGRTLSASSTVTGAAGAASKPKQERTTIDAETKAQLEALGYIGTQAK